jgi:hypothetical protein
VTCTVTDGAKVTADIEDAVTQMETHTIAGITKGLGDLADAFTTISSGIQLCSQQKDFDQLKKLEQMLITFKNPETLAWHIGQDLLVNGISIYKDI